MTTTPFWKEWDEWLTPGRFLLFLSALLLVMFHPVILGGETFFYRDYGVFGYPLAFHHKESFWNGQLPIWNPYNNCGLPFLAQWNTMVFYPGSAIYLALPLPWSLNIFCLAHLVLGGMGAYWLAHTWTGNRLAACVAGDGVCLQWSDAAWLDVAEQHCGAGMDAVGDSLE